MKRKSRTCLRWPPRAAITSSIETKVPAKVPRNKPYLNVSFKAVTITSPFVTVISFLNKNEINHHKKNESPLHQVQNFFTHLGGFFLANRAKIANRARPPLIPAPIEKPLPEATTTRRRISGGIITNAPPGKEEGFDGGVEWATILSLWKPLISSGVSPESAAEAGGDMRRRRKGRNGRVKFEWKLFQKRQRNEWRWELYYFFHYEIGLMCDT